MAQPPRRSGPPPLEDLPPLRDPSAYPSPARIEGSEIVDPQQWAASQPQLISEPVRTIGDEQRERSAEIEAMGVEAWKDAHDSRTELEKKESEVQLPHDWGKNIKVVKTGGTLPPLKELRP